MQIYTFYLKQQKGGEKQCFCINKGSAEIWCTALRDAILEAGHIYVMEYEYVCIADKVNNLTPIRLLTLTP